MLNIAYRITAVPERKVNAYKEALIMNEPPKSVYMDAFHWGNIWNKFRVYEDVLRDGCYSHVCMNDDDLILPMNYKDLVSAIVSRFPDAIHTFYNSRIASVDPTFFKMQSHYMNGAGCVIPTKYLKGFLDFYRGNLQGFKWDDTAMSMYALLNDIDVYLFSPKIIDVIETPSSLSFRKGRYQPHNKGFSDKVSVADIESATVKYKKDGKMNTHLPEGHEIRILCEKMTRDI